MYEEVTMVRYVKKQVSERYIDTPSPSKNLTDQPVVPPIGIKRKFKRGTSRQSLISDVINISGISSQQSFHPDFKVRGIGSRQSLHLNDIKLEKKSATEFGFPRPVERVVVNVDKQRTVHFDDVVRIRYSCCQFCNFSL